MAKTALSSGRRPETRVGLAIRKLRREREMSQKTLADKVGVRQEVISNYEVGDTAIRADHLPRFAEALGVPIDYIFSLIPEDEQTTRTPIPRKKKVTPLPKALEQQAEELLSKTLWDTPEEARYDDSELGWKLRNPSYVRAERVNFTGDYCRARHELETTFLQLEPEMRYVALTFIDTLLDNQRERESKTEEAQ